ncbi:AsnC family transcriptional regulator [Pseudovibrio sp. Tun.PSC04-5.I4]|uniref:Lrp/AsnC family transcriptional regulator n=1 Tax=Pseudovibrio sp. Tun.PSC04-5.I4 TaxID=1798213 RepID=UPI00088A8360|nr:AsnC family transcriptional regulator [Pseudovibrio sp. Tun.PSC04-5.I4]SDR48500.1 DNA-binding transcriptional regulator, Lrp family [Pseudovibrio sp. Tun.PSC04-5.I4]
MNLAYLNKTTDVQLDELDRKLINRLQDGLPVASRPYEIVAAEFAISERELLERIQRLLDTRIFTRFGPMFDIAQLGGAFCLCAMSVPEDRYDEVTETVNALQEVAHNYARDHELNMWFVLATETPQEIQQCGERIEALTGIPVRLFPKEREFFIEFKVPV